MKLYSLSILFIIIGCKSEDTLYLVSKEQYIELGTPAGYINNKGDTIIPLGKYYTCYTDTIRKLGIVMTHDQKLIGIDQNDQKLFEIFWYDSGPDYISEGLFRIIKNDKIGYANKEGEIIINPQYSCAYPFKNGKAKVSFNCITHQGIEGEGNRWESEDWFFIDLKGNKID